MADIKNDIYLVLKNDEIIKYLDEDCKAHLDTITGAIASGRQRDGKKPYNGYHVVNKDEPYADKVLQVILQGEDLKCGNCQREDAPCEGCIRNEDNTDKEDPDLEDLYYHD